jgi:hypothetical protein
MVRPFLRARATIITALLGAFLAPAALAADMPFPVEAPPIEEGPVEWGSNWYLRGDVGPTQISPSTLNGVILSNSFPNNWTIGLGGGYKFNSFMRADITVDYGSLYNKTGPVYAVLPCQIGAETHISWKRPVRPGDRLHVEGSITKLVAPLSRPDRGFASFQLTTFNQEGTGVQTLEATILVFKDPARKDEK